MRRPLLFLIGLGTWMGFSAVTPAAAQDAPENTSSIQDVLAFTQTVSDAARDGDCASVESVLSSLDPGMVERAALVIANISQYSVSDVDIQTVASHSSGIAAAAKNCPVLLEIYKKIATRAVEIRRKETDGA